MGSLFSRPKISSMSTLSREQRALLGPLSQFLRTQIGRIPEEVGEINRILSGDSDLVTSMAQRLYQDALLRPSISAFQRDLAPAINAQFASSGGILSSRRENLMAEALRDIQSEAQAQVAAAIPGLLQTHLGAAAGKASLRFFPTQQAMAFALQGTQTPVQIPGGPGAELLGLLGGTLIGSLMPTRASRSIDRLNQLMEQSLRRASGQGSGG